MASEPLREGASAVRLELIEVHDERHVLRAPETCDCCSHKADTCWDIDRDDRCTRISLHHVQRRPDAIRELLNTAIARDGSGTENLRRVARVSKRDGHLVERSRNGVRLIVRVGIVELETAQTVLLNLVQSDADQVGRPAEARIRCSSGLSLQPYCELLMPRLTVLMPAKNAERYIGRAIRSTLRAIPRDAEVLVWDDASTDATVQVVTSFDDPRVKVTVSPVSVGSGAARDGLLAVSDSEYVAAMDADDVAFRWRFSLPLRWLAEGRSSVVFGSVIRFGERRTPIPTVPSRFTPKEVPWLLAVSNPLFHSTMTARRDAVVASGYGTARVAQDYALWLRIAASGVGMEVHPVALSAYRISASQVSSASGYFDRIRREPEVATAYSRLWDSLIGGPPVSLLSPEDVNQKILAGLGSLSGGTRRLLLRRIHSAGSFMAPVSVRSAVEG